MDAYQFGKQIAPEDPPEAISSMDKKQWGADPEERSANFRGRKAIFEEESPEVTQDDEEVEDLDEDLIEIKQEVDLTPTKVDKLLDM